MEWTEWRCAELARLINEGLPEAKIAAFFNVTGSSISNQKYKLGLTKPRTDLWKKDEDTLLIELWSSKHHSEIAHIMGRSAAAIIHRSIKLGLPKKPRYQGRVINCRICNTAVPNASGGQRYCNPCQVELKKVRDRLAKGQTPRANLWSQERVTKLIDLVKADPPLSSSQIAKQLGISKASVCGKRWRLKLCGTRKVADKVRRPSASNREIRRTRGIAGRWRAGRKGVKPRESIKPAAIKLKPAKPIRRPAGRPDSLNIPFKATKSRQCRYMEGDNHLCCGHETRLGLSWCDYHFLVVYRNDRRTTAMAHLN